MYSKYAYAHFIEGISETDQNKNGELVQFNYPIYAGETNLMSAEEYERFEKDFPGRVEGGIIKQENLVNMINLLYSQLKEEITALPELDDYTRSRFENLRNGFERNGVLTPDHNTESSVNDLANKFFILQEQVRKIQRANAVKIEYHK